MPAVEIQRYLALVQQWAPIESETNGFVKRIFDTQFVDEAEVERQIADSRPIVERHIDRLRTVHLDAAALRSVHERYLAAWGRLLAGYRDIEDGFAVADYGKVSRGRESLLAWRAELRTVASGLRKLADDAHVDPAQNNMARLTTR